ncbi:MAG: hypothetical protein FWB88_07165 [Defluviitaleaceae bacterium]|nr:hypothetical protein [Defluviitaleaceae bacterium]MCL2239350.1 hypothetical protein [Defluviitaleaceae bacterium]
MARRRKKLRMTNTTINGRRRKSAAILNECCKNRLVRASVKKMAVDESVTHAEGSPSKQTRPKQFTRSHLSRTPNAALKSWNRHVKKRLATLRAQSPQDAKPIRSTRLTKNEIDLYNQMKAYPLDELLNVADLEFSE